MSSVFNWKDDKSPSVMLRDTKKRPAGRVYKPTRQPFRVVVGPRKKAGAQAAPD
jgi:hypothetical protein